MVILAPSNLVVTTRGPTVIDMLWDNTVDAGAMEVWENRDAEGYVLRATIDGNKEYYKAENLDTLTSYCYKIRARFYPVGTSAFCNEDCASTFGDLQAPTDVVAFPISGIQIEVTFKDNSGNEVNHRLERKLGAGAYKFVVDLEPNREFWRDGALFLLDVGYTDCVETDIGKQVKDDGGEIGLLIEYDNTRRRWLIDSNGHTIADASAMTITGGTGAGTAARETIGLVSGSSYTYRVRAENGAPTAYATSNQATTIVIPAIPTLAVILEADIEDTSIRIRWSNVANETGYRIEKSETGDLPFAADEGDLIAVVGANVTDFLVTGLDANTAYTFRVRAYNAAGKSAYSAEKAGTTLIVYAPTEFEKWIRNPNIEPVYLAEIYAKMDLTGFTVHDDPCYKKTISVSDRGIDILEVFEDGDAYTEKANAAEVKATASTFWFDYANRILYVHATGGVDPVGFLIEGAFWVYFSTHKDIEFTANGRLNQYLPLLTREDIPPITQEIKKYFEGSFGISSGAIAFMNAKIMGEYFFDKKYADYTWENRKFVLKAGSDDFVYANFKTILTSLIDKKSCNDNKITFTLRDIRQEMERSFVLTKFTVANFPDIEDDFIGEPIPLCFGMKYKVVPIPIEIARRKYKFHDGRSKAVVAVYKNYTVKSNSLIEDTDYFVDLQRSIITFNRDGAFVITAANKKINFQEDAGEKTATLTEDIYTKDELVAEIKSKMDGAGDLTYTVTCSSEKKRFKIKATATFSLLWKTGTSGQDGTDTSVASTIGFDDDEDDTGDVFYEADEDVISYGDEDIIEVAFIGSVNSADEPISNGAEVFKYFMNEHYGLLDSELNLDSIYRTKYEKMDALSIFLYKNTPYKDIVRSIEHSTEAFTFQDAEGRLGLRPQLSVAESKAKYIGDHQIFSHLQSKDRKSLFWKVNVLYNENPQTQDWDVESAQDDDIWYRYKIKNELKIYSYFSAPSSAQSLATSVLTLLNKETIENTIPMLLFDVMAGDIVKFSRDRFYSSAGTIAEGSEINLRIIRISKSPASGQTVIITEII